MDFQSLAERLDQAEDTFWFVPANPEEVSRLEDLLGCRLPDSFRRFLEQCGGGGEPEYAVSGIDETAEKIERGTVWGDTLRCRQEFDLPQDLVVVLFAFEEVCWCLDTSQIHDRECPVVSYGLPERRIIAEIAPTFADFFREHVEHATSE